MSRSLDEILLEARKHILSRLRSDDRTIVSWPVNNPDWQGVQVTVKIRINPDKTWDWVDP